MTFLMSPIIEHVREAIVTNLLTHNSFFKAVNGKHNAHICISCILPVHLLMENFMSHINVDGG